MVREKRNSPRSGKSQGISFWVRERLEETLGLAVISLKRKICWKCRSQWTGRKDCCKYWVQWPLLDLTFCIYLVREISILSEKQPSLKPPPPCRKSQISLRIFSSKRSKSTNQYFFRPMKSWKITPLESPVAKLPSFAETRLQLKRELSVLRLELFVCDTTKEKNCACIKLARVRSGYEIS